MPSLTLIAIVAAVVLTVLALFTNIVGWLIVLGAWVATLLIAVFLEGNAPWRAP